MRERWRLVSSFPNYVVSDHGNVMHIKRRKPLKPAPMSTGYPSVRLSDHGRYKTMAVHRLVAEAFLDKPDGCNVVNHKDENKTNNRVDNLEWCTQAYNNAYGEGAKRRIQKATERIQWVQPMGAEAKKKTVINNTTGKSYSSMTEAANDTGALISHISQVCHGKRRTAGGYTWSFERSA